jgi:SAM-dependent methyltransferase
MKDPTERFTDRVENYVKYRPGYPPEVLALMRDEMSLTPESIVADVGSGTGILTRMFLDNGNAVFAVEPNDAMRDAAERSFAGNKKFHSVKGTAEETFLDADSVDIIAAAQAFHWFDPIPAGSEFRRILKPNGYIALIWNERELDTTPFLRDYEKFLLEFADDYRSVRHENISNDTLRTFFEGDYNEKEFPNEQVLNFEGLRGRAISSSYIPPPGSPRFSAMNEALASLFAKHSENDRIRILYRTKIYYKQV